ncbi:MAG TPA: glutamyl-tRNA reductase [Planctomycetota bacterium]
MERVAIAGLSLHQTDVDGLARAKRGLAALAEPAVKALADELGASEAVLLSTCNRLELVFARERGHGPGPADRAALARALGLAAEDELVPRIFLHAGRGAARHLFRVAASLDSLVLGEDQILTQVRAALDEARVAGLTGPILGALFDHALQVGKRVRTRTDLAHHAVSVVSLGVAFLAERLRDLPDARIAVIGAGATGAHAARALAAAGLGPAFVVNRTPARAAALAAEVGARVRTLEELQAAGEPLDALVSATSAPGFVLDAPALERLARRARPGRRLLAVDLAVPRDLAPCPAVEALDLEHLRARAEENRRLRAAAAAEAELLVEERVDELFRERAAARVQAPFAAVAAETRELFELELARLCTERLAHLAPHELEQIERWARTTFGRLAHVPFRALKRLARGAPPAEWEGVE